MTPLLKILLIQTTHWTTLFSYWISFTQKSSLLICGSIYEHLLSSNFRFYLSFVYHLTTFQTLTPIQTTESLYLAVSSSFWFKFPLLLLSLTMFTSFIRVFIWAFQVIVAFLGYFLFLLQVSQDFQKHFHWLVSTVFATAHVLLSFLHGTAFLILGLKDPPPALLVQHSSMGQAYVILKHAFEHMTYFLEQVLLNLQKVISTVQTQNVWLDQ